MKLLQTFTATPEKYEFEDEEMNETKFSKKKGVVVETPKGAYETRDSEDLGEILKEELTDDDLYGGDKEDFDEANYDFANSDPDFDRPEYEYDYTQ